MRWISRAECVAFGILYEHLEKASIKVRLQWFYSTAILEVSEPLVEVLNHVFGFFGSTAKHAYLNLPPLSLNKVEKHESLEF